MSVQKLILQTLFSRQIYLIVRGGSRIFSRGAEFQKNFENFVDLFFSQPKIKKFDSRAFQESCKHRYKKRLVTILLLQLNLSKYFTEPDKRITERNGQRAEIRLRSRKH